MKKEEKSKENIKKNNKDILIGTCIFVAILVIVIIVFVYFYKDNVNTNNDLNSNSTANEDTITDTNSNNYNIYVTDFETNNQIFNVKNVKLHVINSYDENMFKGNNTLIFMFGSWCHSCEEEISVIKETVNKYSNNSNFKIVLIAHETKQDDGNISSIVSLINDGSLDFAHEILIDLDRVVRKELDPEANSIPMTYFLDSNCNILEKIDGAATQDLIDTAISTYYIN